MESDVFAALTGGAHFNRKKFGKDMDVFRPHHHQVSSSIEAAAFPAPAGAQPAGKKKKKKERKGQRTAGMASAVSREQRAC
jgi:hypothetical protein